MRPATASQKALFQLTENHFIFCLVIPTTSGCTQSGRAIAAKQARVQGRL